MNARKLAAIGAIILGSSGFAQAGAAFDLVNRNLFLDSRSINDVGEAPGSILQFGGDIKLDTGRFDSSRYYAAGIFTPDPSNTKITSPVEQSFVACDPFAASPGFCERGTTFGPAKLDGTWQFEVSSHADGSGAVTFNLPGTPASGKSVPFPSDVTITNSADGLTPTIKWHLPDGFTADALRVQIFDRSNPSSSGVADIIHSVDLDPADTEYVLPTTLSSGQSLVSGNGYSINFQVIKTRDGTSDLSHEDHNILKRSSSFFDFTAEPGGTAPPAVLPMVDGDTGVYHFNVSSVSSDSVTYIDPDVAIGYVYKTAMDDPNFASVFLPDVGDGIYDISYGSCIDMVNVRDDTAYDHSTCGATQTGDQYFFGGTGGVSEFTVTGIETSANLDPSDTQAFVTGLTFAGPGSFHGTMTPIVASAPEPASLAVFGFGLAGFGWVRRRQRAA